MNLKKITLNKALIVAGGLIGVAGLASTVVWHKDIDISGLGQIAGKTSAEEASSITGEPCKQAKRRPMAVMFASDPVARPLAGISQADMVFEMPVTPDGVTRMMGIFQCQEPDDVGSIRSARQDFVPLAAGMKAIYAHWGGERDVLIQLDQKVVNNIDGLKYENSTFYRKKGVRPPHNGFAKFSSLLDRARQLGYSLENAFEGYPHGAMQQTRSLLTLADLITVPYSRPFNVEWKYDSAQHVYARYRGQEPEKDSLSGEQVIASTVVVMETTARPTGDQYVSVRVTGQGSAMVYQDGLVTAGTWKKGTALADKLYFYDSAGKEIPFLPGKIWVEIVTP